MYSVPNCTFVLSYKVKRKTKLFTFTNTAFFSSLTLWYVGFRVPNHCRFPKVIPLFVYLTGFMIN